MIRFHRFSPLFILSLIFTTHFLIAQPPEVTDTEKVKELLEDEIENLEQAVGSQDENAFLHLKRLQDIGDWAFVERQIQADKRLSHVEKQILKARRAWLENDFFEMEEILKALPPADQKNPEAQRLYVVLHIEAWELDNAVQLAKKLLQENSDDLETERILGRALILQKNYEEALALAEQRIAKNPEETSGYFLKADVHFWDQEPDKAEKTLEKALSLDPFNADGRFFYGYAIWRRIDATQLDAMMAQWELALLLNPLHFQTHWHLGNGHTNLNFSDYADPQEEAIRKALEGADQKFTAEGLEEALRIVDKVAIDYPASVLPAMHKASLLYSDFDAQNRKENLAEAERIFLEILERKVHYGSAHNGLAAVIKSQRIPYLHQYEELKAKFLNEPIDNLKDMLEVFPDVGYYPGNLVKGMVWNQFYTSVVYFPFLVAQHRQFVIPPLHEDLALAMNNSYFRYNTTFDNRQWMDIRGVGSGAAGIGYVERGAFGERNVLLHEYVHLFHMVVLTDAEKRKIRSLYYHAMENGLTLDYYSQNNEHEYFAQTYPAFFEAEKVHPLDFKSMNTTADLKQKDPKMYRFLKELVEKEQAYLNGNREAMASNWAQVYVNLAKNVNREEGQKAYEYLDKALDYDEHYLPAYLAYIEFLIADREFEQAKIQLAKAKEIDSGYAPLYRLEGDLERAIDLKNIDRQAVLYQKAYALETDYMEKAQNGRILRNFYHQRALLSEALKAAEEYVENTPKISTYLRDAREEAQAYSAWQRGILGDQKQVEVLAYLVAQRPHNYGMRLQYVEVLLALNKGEKALNTLLPSYQNLQASKVDRPDFELRVAHAYHLLKNQEKAMEYLDKIQIEKLSEMDQLALLQLQMELDKTVNFTKRFEEIKGEGLALYESELAYTRALFALQQENNPKALLELGNALQLNPFHIKALKKLKTQAKTDKKAEKFLQKGVGKKAEEKINSVL